MDQPRLMIWHENNIDNLTELILVALLNTGKIFDNHTYKEPWINLQIYLGILTCYQKTAKFKLLEKSLFLQDKAKCQYISLPCNS